jgi:hypothetical protein
MGEQQASVSIPLYGDIWESTSLGGHKRDFRDELTHLTCDVRRMGRRGFYWLGKERKLSMVHFAYLSFWPPEFLTILAKSLALEALLPPYR